MAAAQGAVSKRTAAEQRASRRTSGLLTLAVLMLIYQQVPAPLGITIVQSWMHYAIWATGTLLLAQCTTRLVKTARLQIRRAIVWVRKFRHGFRLEFRSEPDGKGVDIGAGRVTQRNPAANGDVARDDQTS